jgi:hypothetical protein
LQLQTGKPETGCDGRNATPSFDKVQWTQQLYPDTLGFICSSLSLANEVLLGMIQPRLLSGQVAGIFIL